MGGGGGESSQGFIAKELRRLLKGHFLGPSLPLCGGNIGDEPKELLRGRLVVLLAPTVAERAVLLSPKKKKL